MNTNIKYTYYSSFEKANCAMEAQAHFFGHNDHVDGFIPSNNSPFFEKSIMSRKEIVNKLKDLAILFESYEDLEAAAFAMSVYSLLLRGLISRKMSHVYMR